MFMGLCYAFMYCIVRRNIPSELSRSIPVLPKELSLFKFIIDSHAFDDIMKTICFC